LGVVRAAKQERRVLRQSSATEDRNEKGFLNIFAAQFLCYRYNKTIYALGAMGAGPGKLRVQIQKYLSLHKRLCYSRLPTSAHHGRGYLRLSWFYIKSKCS